MSTLSSAGLADDQSALVFNGGSLAPTGGGGEIVTNSGAGSTYVISSGQTSNYTLTSGDTLSVVSGGTDSGSTVYSGATVSVLAGGNSQDDVLSGGAIVAIDADIAATTLLSGASMSLLAGAQDSNDTFNSGTSLFESGTDTAIRFDTFSGAIVVVGSGAQTYDDQFDAGTTASFGSGSVVGFDFVNSGAVASVAAGASVYTYGVESGGELFLASGASANNTMVHYGATIGVSVPFGSGETVSYNSSTKTLTVTSGVLSASATFGSVQSSSHLIVTSAPGGGTLVTFACFADGTRIATPSGQTRVEHLREGDLVQTVSGAARPVRWMGYRRLHTADAVRVRADAFGPGRPVRDLVLSPEHAVYTQGVLIPVRHLIDDVSIVQERAERITYWHVELDSHDVLLAEGLPCESWLDTGNRAMFENAAVPDLHPSFARGASTSAYAPVVEHGALIAIARRGLAGRRKVRDVVLPSPGTVRIAIAPGTTSIRLVSVSGRSAGDARRRGALIRTIRLDGARVPLDDARLRRGFHEVERHGADAVRWTDGAGVIAVTGARLLEVEVCALFAATASGTSPVAPRLEPPPSTHRLTIPA